MVKNNVRLLRSTKSISQQELADAVGVTRQTIGLIENHKYNPTIILCLRLAKILGTTLDELFWLEGDKN